MQEYTHITDLDDLDFMGIVSHYKWIQLFERYRTKLWDKQFDLLLKENLGLVIRKVEAEYFRPAKFRDQITFTCHVQKIGGASFSALQVACDKNKKPFAEAFIHFICINSELKPTKIPEYLKSLEE